jgi:DNA-binding NarL/FixJ family response regulator
MPKHATHGLTNARKDSMSRSSILLVEDHAAFANALLHILNRDENLNVVAVAETAEQALEQLPELRVDLVLVDVSLPQMSGISLVAALREKYPDLPCVMLSGHLSAQYARRALDAGARGYLLKDNPMGILTGIQHIVKGEIYVSEELGEV